MGSIWKSLGMGGKALLVDPYFLVAGLIRNHYDGFMIEVHNNPEFALTDKDQQLTTSEFYKTLVDFNRNTGNDNINTKKED